MIKFDIPDFCQNCPEFEPKVDKEVHIADDFFMNRKEFIKTTVTCIHVQRCLSMMDYIVNRAKEKENNNGKN